MSILAALVAVEPLGAQTAAATGAGGGIETARGFNSEAIVFELSLFLPREALGKAFGAAGSGAYGRAGGGGTANQGGGGSNGGVGGVGGGYNGGGGAGAGGAGSGGGGASPQGQIPQFIRDPKLFLTKDQVDRLLPLLATLRDNAIPSPSKARQIEAELNTIITKEQRAEYADWQRAMARLRQELRQRFASSGGQGAYSRGGGAPGASGSPDLSGGPGASGTPGAGGAPGASGTGAGGAPGSDVAPLGRASGSGTAGGHAQAMSQLQRRQKLLDSFIAALKEYRKGL